VRLLAVSSISLRQLAAVSALLLATGALPASGATAGATGEAADALRLVEAYNSRNLGSPGFRKVRLDLRNYETVTQTFTVINVWRREETGVRTAFVLEEPADLRGTNYLLVEDPSETWGIKVFLNLPSGKQRVLSVQPSYFDIGLLGSDFGYRDVRMLIPVEGFNFRIVGRDELLGRPVYVLEATTTESSAWPRSLLYLSADPPMLLGVDRFSDTDASTPSKRMRVEGLKQVRGVWTETRIVIQSDAKRSSVLSLLDFESLRSDISAELFTPDALPSLTSDALRGPQGGGSAPRPSERGRK
jgi:hypothetical protein